MQSWAEEEFSGASLGDKRLNRRLIEVARTLGEKPTASIPSACGGWADTQATYRFFDQASEGKKNLGWEDALAPHLVHTQTRMGQHSVVLCIQDTTELDFEGKQTQGHSPLSYEPQRGMYLHPSYAVTPQREPLGVLDAWIWAREPKDPSGKRPGLLESTRWIEGYERIAELAQTLPNTRLVYVADREADILVLLQRAHALGTPADWLIRSQHNRSLPEGGKLWEQVDTQASLGEIEFTLPARPGHAQRQVRQQLKAHHTELDDGKGGKFPVTCLIAREINPPTEKDCIEWRLLTNRPIHSQKEAKELIDWYRCRWEIETFFHTLKNGFRIESLQLGSIAKLELALAVYMVSAWRLARLIQRARVEPELDASLFFSEDEWKSAYILDKKPIPKKPPKLRELIRLIAKRGGFLGRKGDGEPGVKTLWQGFMEIRTFASGLAYMRSSNAI